MPEQFIRVRPAPTEEYLANPHKGCCTFQHFNGDELFPGTFWSEAGPTEFPPPVTGRKAPGGRGELTVKGYLPTTVAYCRWFWEIMEPQQGRYDFSVIEKSLAVCKERGQRLAFRVMAFGAPGQPQVPKWYSDKCQMQRYEGKDFLIPVPNSPEYLEHWGGFIRELGRRFDGHPLVENYTPAFVGPWGEGAADMCDEQVARFADVFCQAFPRTIKIWEFTGSQMRIGLAKGGGGWRANCFGDLGDVGSDAVTKDVSWNHHYDIYPQHIVESGVSDAWRTGPVFFETCWVPMHWYNRGWDLDFIIQQGLKFHTTYFMPKYTYLPDAWMDKLATFCRLIGYRYVFRQARFESQVPREGPLAKTAFDGWIENVGVAPIYYRYDFALRFRQDDNAFVVPFKDVDTRTWLPGDICIRRQVALPKGLRPGLVELSAGLIDPDTQEAKVSFANRPCFKDRWLMLGKFEAV
ncbi:MAG: DUF4832 domain-containing protein [Phycisphaerae bacterium]